MVIFREVGVWPNGGFADRPWLPEPDEDAFAGSDEAPASCGAEDLQWPYV
ncbi:hypothetical protein AB0M46_31510 [Dactylosporangium sp. NPDC051485]